MIKIDYPKYPFSIREEDEKEWIFDPVRKKWVRLTPEEWVRQNFLQYLLLTKAYPSSFIAIEKEFRLGELRKRFDIVVYKNMQPWMIIECKEMNVRLHDPTLKQILNYNITLQAAFLVITNGHDSHAWAIAGNNVHPLSELPDFD